MALSLTIPIAPLNQYSYKHHFFLIGSCFASNIGQKLIDHEMSTDINPFGVLFHPLAIYSALEQILQQKQYTANDLVFHNELFHSWHHNGSFSNPNESIVREHINRRILDGHQFIKDTNVLILTFGTAWVYELLEEGMIVANCHKFPNLKFRKRLLEIDEIVDGYATIIELIRSVNPLIKVILTVSPVRHWKDGASENQVSKSILHVAKQKILEQHKDVSYFPAYEIMMDELRDYRYYNRDLLHPNEHAIDIIWERFIGSMFDAKTKVYVKEFTSLAKMKAHKVLFPETKKAQEFIQLVKKTQSIFKKRFDL